MGPFLDTPAKRYSSGMYMRLAFAVAAHLDPEILLVDEVLAVGDAQFQQKCLGQMNRVSNSGRTILFVSHQMPAVQALCERAILLSGGGIAAMGPTRDVIGTYLSGGNQPQGAKLDVSTCRDRTRFSEMAIKEVWIENDQGSLASVVGMGEGLTLCYRFEASRCIFNPGFGFGIDDHNGVRLFSANNYFGPQSKIPRSASQGVVRCRFAALPLLPATYHVSMSLVEDNRMIVDYLERVVSFTLEPRDVLGSGKIPRPDQGIFFLPAKIDIEV
jgi:lipopolysaccharide transport system ATP-binding protein